MNWVNIIFFCKGQEQLYVTRTVNMHVADMTTVQEIFTMAWNEH